MKRVVMILAVTIWSLIAQVSMAFDYSSVLNKCFDSELCCSDIDVLSFEKTRFVPGQQLDVYSGPGEYYYRGTDEKAGVSTDEDILCAGRIGKWIMVEYLQNDNHTRCVGYVDSDKFIGAPDCDEIHFENIPVFVWGNTYLMDAPTRNSTCIAMLEIRHPATLLAWHADILGEYNFDSCGGLKGWAYVETVVDDQPVRGFIDPVMMDDYRIGDERMNIGTVTENKLKELYAFRYKYLKRGAIGQRGGLTAALNKDGTIRIAGEDNLPEMKEWTDIVAISMGGGFAVGLKADGTVVATGCNKFGQCNVESWRNIVAVSAGEDHTVGLVADGTVVMAGSKLFQQDYVKVWDNIVEISAGGYHTVGLRADGAVLIAGGEYDSESESDWWAHESLNIMPQKDVELWNKMSLIEAKGCSTVGLRYDGSVLFSGDCVCDQNKAQDWRDMRNIAVGWNSVYGVDFYGDLYNTWTSDLVCGWGDVVCLVASDRCVLGVQPDGTVLLAKGWVYSDSVDEFEKMADEIVKWKDIGLSEESVVFGF